MSKPETSFTASIHKHLPPGRKDPYWIKNSNLYTAGQFDCWYSGRVRDLWVEYKFLVMPKRPDTMIDFGLSELQKAWGRGREAEGRNLAVIVGCKEGGVILRGSSAWEPPMRQDRFEGLLTSRKQIADWIMDFTVRDPSR